MIEAVAQAAESAIQTTTEGVALPIDVVTVTMFLHIAAFIFACGVVYQKVKDIRDNIKEYKKIGERISRIEGRVTMRNPDLYEKNSPISLTDKGVLLLKESGTEAHIQKNRESLLQHFKKINNPLDIQDNAEILMEQELKKDDRVKEYVFLNGESMKDVAGVAGIALRDIVFEEKGIEIKREKVHHEKKEK